MSDRVIRQDAAALREVSGRLLSPAALRIVESAIGRRSCPNCGMLIHPATAGGDCQIAWSDTDRQFTVEAFIPSYCGHCVSPGTRAERVALASIPLEIAQTSSCSCGATLTLRDYSLQLSDGDLRFSAVYACDACTERRRAAEHGIGGLLVSLWNRTKKVKIGPDGVEYEKEAIK
jgi:hypothetical protein